jgi:hypothetical protein
MKGPAHFAPLALRTRSSHTVLFTFGDGIKKPLSGRLTVSHEVAALIINLQLRGVTKSITFPATIVVSPTVISVESTFSINRKEFGINYAGAADNLIRDEVVLTLNIRATK